MQTMTDVAPIEVIHGELYRLDAGELVQMVHAVGELHDTGEIDREVHDYLLFQILAVTDARVKKD
jgi:hypothetical protein